MLAVPLLPRHVPLPGCVAHEDELRPRELLGERDKAARLVNNTFVRVVPVDGGGTVVARRAYKGVLTAPSVWPSRTLRRRQCESSGWRPCRVAPRRRPCGLPLQSPARQHAAQTGPLAALGRSVPRAFPALAAQGLEEAIRTGRRSEPNVLPRRGHKAAAQRSFSSAGSV